MSIGNLESSMSPGNLMKKTGRKTFSSNISAFDVAAYIISNHSITSWKLQKILYYCQAWSLVWEEEPLFIEKIVAYINGPVVKDLYDAYKRELYIFKSKGGDDKKLSRQQKHIIKKVIACYGNHTAQWINDVMSRECPWSDSIEGQEISITSLYEYYSSI